MVGGFLRFWGWSWMVKGDGYYILIFKVDVGGIRLLKLYWLYIMGIGDIVENKVKC